MTLPTGNRLGPYEIIAPLGAGGMGEVYRARDTRLDRSVAVKVLNADFAGNADLRARFDREARTISQLNHPNICALYDVGHEGGIDFLVMELLEGETLAERLDQGALPLAEVLRSGAQIADALARAHRQGITHRDLKPGNVILTKAGAKLLDFGLAKTLTSAKSASAPVDVTEHKPLTQEGTVLGTFQYMAPEQLAGEEADARSDIFALGAVLYEMATGVRAFTGKNRTSLVANIMGVHPRPISELQPLTPPALERLIQRCLAKDPDERWQSAHDVAEELRWIAEAGSQAGVSAPASARRRTRERLAWIIALLALAGLATIAARWFRSGTPASAYSLIIPRADGPYSLAGPVSVSPDGKLVCFAARGLEGKSRQIFIRSLASFDVRSIEGTDDPESTEWSPDSHSVVFTAAGRLKVVDVDGGPVRTIVENRGGAGFSMNRGGTVLLGSGVSGISRVSANGGPVKTITFLRPHEAAHMFPVFLPDGNRFLFISFVRDPSRREQPHYLLAGSLDSKRIKVIGEIPSAVRYDESGHLLFVREGTVMAIRFDADSLEMNGEAQPLAEGVFYFQPTGATVLSASLNGVVTYRASIGGQSLVWMDRSGHKTGSIGSVGQFHDFRLSTDQLSVVATVVDGKIGTGDLWSYSTRRETSARLTSDPGYEAAAVLTPDGKKLIYSTDHLGAPDIFVKQIGSPGEDRPLVVAAGVQSPSDVSADGRFLIYESDELQGEGSDLYVMALDGSMPPKPFVKTPFHESEGRFSPNGKWVAYQSNESGSSQIYVRSFPGPGPARQVSAKGGTLPRWSADGRQLYFRDAKQIYVADVGSTDAEPALVFETQQRFGSFEVSPDGRFLLSMYDDLALQAPARVIVNWPELLRQRAVRR